MKKHIITISDSGMVHIPTTVSMQDFEITQLFGVFQQTVKANIRTILKSGVSCGDTSKGGVVVGNSIIPDYFGLDMVIAIAFRVQSPKAKIFRQWVIKRLTDTNSNRMQPMFIQLPNNSKLN